MSDRGAMLVPAIALVMSLTMVGVVLLETSTDVVERVERRAQDVRLSAIGDAAIDLAMQGLWSSYRAGVDEDDHSTETFRSFLDTHGITAAMSAEDYEGEFHVLGIDTDAAAPWADLRALSGLPLGTDGTARLDGAELHLLEVLREDAPLVTVLRIRATLSFGGDPARRVSRTVERLYFADGEEFQGFEFALLANNVNCIMCHANVDSAARYYNRDPARYGTFPRVRVGTLESLKIRANSADSDIAGALYTRGPVMDKDGTLLADLTRSSLRSVLFDAEGKIVQDFTGDVETAPFVNTTGDPLPPFGTLYMNYPRNNEKQTDGPFPEEFPPVVPDGDGDRYVDAAEFASVADGAKGTITGGRKVRVPEGASYPHPGLSPWDESATLSGVVSGHAVMHGTAASPLQIAGTVAVDGDVVVSGLLKGAGVLLARGNVYVVGSLTYADGTGAGGHRTFGVAADGTENRLTLAAGGSVMIGDFMTSKSGGGLVTGDPDGDFNFTISELVIFNQMEWSRTQTTLPDSGGNQVANPLYEPGYVPRYYVMQPGTPVSIYNKGDTYFSPATKTWLGKEHLGGWSTSSLTIIPAGDPRLDGATVMSLVPESGWLTATQLVTMFETLEDAHPGGPFVVDAFVYTNNSIQLLSRKSSAYGGQALINGGLVGADLGILTAGGLQLNFDERHDGALNLKEARRGELILRRSVRLR